ncbi:MAG: single-stranded-DNA-specific exonuclease RecJ [Alphaproteobacteria bacterium]
MSETAERDGFLGVERSICDRRWRVRPGDERLALALSQRLELPDIVGRLLAARGIDLDSAESFLNPTLRTVLPDPSELLDMDMAAARIARAVTQGEGIAIFGDYDVDGATSSAVLLRFFRAVDAHASVYIPDRQKEGYGPNAPALLKLKAEGAGVVVTVDCGTTAFEPLATAKEAGLDVIIVDHHVAEPELPARFAMINPNRLDETRTLGNLAAVGVAFLLAVAVNRELRRIGWFRERAEPDLLEWLDLVALGTVCDAVPLTGVNRAYVTQGLKAMTMRRNVGLCALSDTAGLDQPPNAYHLGYVLGPRVNAGGRVGNANLGVRLLTTDDREEALVLAHRLEELNQERRAIETRVLAEASAEAEAKLGAAPVLLVAGEDWHSGVIGIIASRLAQRYERPTAVVSLAGETGRASARSVAGVDLGAAVTAARQAGLLVHGGGHPMAAGFTVERAKLPALEAFLIERLGPSVASAGADRALSIDGALAVSAATPEFITLLERVGPFGNGNSEPRFALPDAQIMRAEVVGSDHVLCRLSGREGGRLKAIAFRSAGTPLGRALLEGAGGTLHIAGHLRIDNWQGSHRAQLLIDDAALS